MTFVKVGHIMAFMHQSFVTTAPPPHPTPPTGNSGDNNFSSITALLKALHRGDLLGVIALLFIRVNFTGVGLRNITSPAFTRYCGGTQKVIALTLALLSPTHPHRWGEAGVTLQMTGTLSKNKTWFMDLSRIFRQFLTFYKTKQNLAGETE